MLVFSVVSVIILLAASMTGYFFAKTRVSENIEKQMTAIINAHVNKIDGWLVAKQKVVEITAGTMQTSVGNGDVPSSLLSGYRSIDRELSDVYFGSVEGKMVDGSGWTPPADFDPRTRVWFKKAMEQNKVVFTDPYLDASTKQMAVSVALPYKAASGQVLGVVSADILLQTLIDNIKGINFEGQGFAFLVDSKGVILAHPDTEVVSKNITGVEKLKEIANVFKEITGKEQGYKNYQENGKDMIMVYKHIPSTQWLLCISVDESFAYQPLVYLRWLFIGVTIVSILLVIAVTFVVARRLTEPLGSLTRQVDLLASGNLTVQADVKGTDEFAKLTQGFNEMVVRLRDHLQKIHNTTADLRSSSNHLIDIATSVAANSQEMSAKVCTVSATVEQISANIEETASSTEEVSHSVDSVAEMAKLMSEASKSTAKTAEFVSREVNQVTSVVEEISQSINLVASSAGDVSTSMDDISQAVQTINKSLNSINVNCERSIGITTEAEERSRETTAIIQKLNTTSKQINKIIDIIRNIAEQTNMLALNATIEAAGAGEAGKGFAVVAAEVKELAKRTGEETRLIAHQIEEMQNDMSEAVSAVDRIADVISETKDITGTIAAAVTEQSKSVDDISNAMAQGVNKVTAISSEISEIAVNAAQVAKSATEASGGVKAMFDATVDISQKSVEVAESTDKMASVMSNIAYATKEVAQGTQEISENIQEADAATADTANKASQTSEAAYSLGEMANQLETLVDKFKV
jgi:methyl-accepting chemotaxis protein